MDLRFALKKRKLEIGFLNQGIDCKTTALYQIKGECQMGLIKAAAGAGGGVLADQWKE